MNRETGGFLIVICSVISPRNRSSPFAHILLDAPQYLHRWSRCLCESCTSNSYVGYIIPISSVSFVLLHFLGLFIVGLFRSYWFVDISYLSSYLGFCCCCCCCSYLSSYIGCWWWWWFLSLSRKVVYLVWDRHLNKW